jgi:glutathione synthase/RimK-type ligase-like ATP-grasp enzyme
VRLAFLVPAPDYPEPWRWAFDAEAAALERRGVTVEPLAWTEAGDLRGYDLVLPLVAWGYHLRYREWLDFLDRAEAEGLPIANPPPLLRWNSDKAYLAQLGAQGIPSVPTIEVPALVEPDLRRAAEQFGTAELVVKPPVSASATGTHRIRPGDPIPPSEHAQRMMIQPFLPTIATEGEYALILFDGRLSHTLVKRPRPGDFRVQPHLGGTTVKCDAPAGAEELALAALAAAPADATYARVDIIRDEKGELRIMELELVEPALWLDVAPHGEEAFARALISAALRTGARMRDREAS